MDTAHVELGTVYDLHVLSMCMCLSRQSAQQLSLVAATRNTLAELVLHASG